MGVLSLIRRALQFPRIVRPVEEGLALARAAGEVARAAIISYLRAVTAERFPSLYLPLVFFAETPAHIVAAIPLKPAARVVFFIDPSFLFPDGEWLARVYFEVIEGVVVFLRREFCARKPTLWKFFCAVGHIFAAKDAESEHFLWG